MSGFGTVVTGTLTGGSLRIGDEIEIQPVSQRGRIRGLQSYKQQVEVAPPGSRVAVNLAGLEKRAVERGNVISHPGQLQPTKLVDVRFRYLSDVDRPLKHNAEVKVFSGTAESSAYVRLLGEATLAPGSEGWLQLRLESSMALAQGDRFILRYPSPAQTIGGGVIVNPHPGKRWRRFQPSVLQQLETQMLGSPAQRVAQAAEGLEPIKRGTLQKSTGYGDKALEAAIRDAIAEGVLLELPDSLYWATVSYQSTLHRMLDELATFHQSEPLRLGMSREELRSRMSLKQATLNLMLNMQDTIVAERNLVRLAEHRVQFDQRQQVKIAELLTIMNQTRYTPPSFADAAQIVGEDVLYTLIELDEIVQVQPDVIFTQRTYDEMVAGTLEIIDREGSISAKTLRDRFDTSRKYAIGLLEHLDSIGVTKRVGDERVRGRKS
jgi:selenocysteine-specific elongation factor